MPAEPEGSQFADKVKIASYPVEELGGLIWAYVGPQPAPLVPRWRPLVLEGAFRHVATTTDPMQLAAMHGELGGPGAL